MRDHHHGLLACASDLQQQVEHLTAGGFVLIAERLVHQDQLGIVDQRTTHGDALHLPHGKLTRPVMHAVAKPHLRQQILRTPLGIAIVGGLCLSQVLTLYITPVVYYYLDKVDTYLSGRKRKQAPEGFVAESGPASQAAG